MFGYRLTLNLTESLLADCENFFLSLWPFATMLLSFGFTQKSEAASSEGFHPT
jgi:hypothetical protein